MENVKAYGKLPISLDKLFENEVNPHNKPHFQNGKWENFVPGGSAIIVLARLCQTVKAIVAQTKKGVKIYEL